MPNTPFLAIIRSPTKEDATGRPFRATQLARSASSAFLRTATRTFAGRLGFALDRVLLYGKGGTAFAAPPPLGDMAHQPVDHNLTPVDVYFGRGPAILTFQESPIRKAKRKDVTELRGIAGSCDRPGLIAYLGGPHFFPRVAASITLLN